MKILSCGAVRFKRDDMYRLLSVPGKHGGVYDPKTHTLKGCKAMTMEPFGRSIERSLGSHKAKM